METVGSSADKAEIEKLMHKAESRIRELNPQTGFDFPWSEKNQIIEEYLKSNAAIEVHSIGPELVLGRIFDSIGFGKIPEELFRHIVLARLTYPVSKLKTADYLFAHHGFFVDVERIYRFLDRFHKHHKADVERIAYEYTKKTLKNITVVFYDMTTLYFEAEDEDDLRKIGFSKDGKFQCPQIMLGLLVGEDGYPIGYDIFEGNKFEGHTLIPVIERMQKKYGFPKPVVVADSGLLSGENLNSLKEKKYEFILGARIKNESKKMQKEILEKTRKLKNGEHAILTKSDGTKLIVSFSDNRAKKDGYNREKGLKKLRERISSGKLTKGQISNRGYSQSIINWHNIPILETGLPHYISLFCGWILTEPTFSQSG